MANKYNEEYVNIMKMAIYGSIQFIDVAINCMDDNLPLKSRSRLRRELVDLRTNTETATEKLDSLGAFPGEEKLFQESKEYLDILHHFSTNEFPDMVRIVLLDDPFVEWDEFESIFQRYKEEAKPQQEFVRQLQKDFLIRNNLHEPAKKDSILTNY